MAAPPGGSLTSSGPAPACNACATPLPVGSRFCPSCGAAAGPAPAADERRPVTILFVDLVGSTALAERFDPEDWKAIVDGALARFAVAIEAHGGHVAQLLGDGLLAFFGAPVAHEDDPMRAIRAGLQVIASLSQGPPAGSSALQVRVGIHGGEVVVGGVGGPGRHEYLAVGDAVNVAARLQSAAAPMTVLVSEDTYRQVAAAVDGRDRGPLRLAGKAEPVRAVEIVGIRDARGRGTPLRSAAAFVGRVDELRRLTGLTDRLDRSGGAVVRVAGEPGMGKTRLLEEWRQTAQAAGGDGSAPGWIQVGCRTIGREIPYDLASALARASLGIPEGARPSAARRALRAAPPLPERDAPALLGWLVGVSPTASEAAILARIEGRTRQARAGVALRALLDALARRAPMVVVIEDVHWIDPSSADLVAAGLPAAAVAPLVICLTARPETTPATERLDRAIEDLPGARRVTLELAPLDQAAQATLAGGLLGDAVPDALRDLVAARCDGNPLFIEELLAVLRERGLLLREAGSWSLAEGGLPVPPGLLGLLVARLDTLRGPVRRLALIASVVGRSAAMADVWAIAGEAGDGEAATVDDPVADAGGLLGWDGEPGGRLTFRHALVHEAAYSLLTRAERRRLHRVVARHLEREAIEADRLAEAAATLAHHYAEAGELEPARRHAMAAAERAAAQYANQEAIALYGIAIQATRALLADAAVGAAQATIRRSELADLLIKLGWLLALGGRYAESVGVTREALELLPGDPSVERALALTRLASRVDGVHDYDEEERLLIEAEGLLEALPEPHDTPWWRAWIDVRSARASFAYWLGRTGELAAMLDSLQQPVMEHATTAQRATYEHTWVFYLHRRDAFGPSADVMVHARAAYAADTGSDRLDDLGWAEFMFGFSLLFNRDVDDAIVHLRRAIATAPVISDTLLDARASAYLLIACRLGGRVDEAVPLAEHVVDINTRLGIDQYVAIGLANQAWLRMRAGDAAAARELAERAESTWPASPPMPLRWLDAWPAIAADAALGEERLAIARCRTLLQPDQWPPAEPVARALRRVVAAAEDPDADVRVLLGETLGLAREEGYL